MNRFLMRLAISLIAVLIAIAASMMAVGYFTIALFFLLQEYLAPGLAALATGLGILIVAALIILFASSMIKSTKIPAKPTADNAAELGSMLGRKLHAYAKSHKGPAAAVALGLGLAVGFSPKLRRFLRDVLKA